MSMLRRPVETAVITSLSVYIQVRGCFRPRAAAQKQRLSGVGCATGLYGSPFCFQWAKPGFEIADSTNWKWKPNKSCIYSVLCQYR